MNDDYQQPDDEALLPSVIVPLEKISSDALSGLIEEFILREGTDYGAHEYSLEQKHAQVHKQIASGRVFIVFDPNEQTASIVRKEDLAADM
jgi:uncharacterized protein